jgi:L-alanine-DL-glutamate epimerase-like enolase superfamily enzyme
MIITDTLLFTLIGQRNAPDYSKGDRQAQLLDIYPEFNAQDWAKDRISGLQSIRATYVEITTDEDVNGLFGPIDEEQAFVIHNYLRPFLQGRDPLAIELLSDQMMRLHRHGRSGLFVTGISAIDCAIWDLKGKAWEQPIYRLLGGPTRSTVPAYASMLGFSVQPEDAVLEALETKQKGFAAQKWFFRYGPADGEDGLIKNIALVKALRDALGPHYPLMVDAFMGWDLPYAREMLKALAPFNLTWLEEPMPPERVGAFANLKAGSSTPIATGEHVATRWQVKELLVSNSLDWIQTDPDWCGGITELVKICVLASAFQVPVAAHGHSLLAALHVAGSQSPSVVPYVEYLIQHQAAKQYFHQNYFQPVNGQIVLPEMPGLGIVLDDAKIVDRVDYIHTK